MNVLRTASDSQLAGAVEENLFDLFRAMAASLPDGECQQARGLYRHLSFPANPMFKGAWLTQLAEADVEAAIDETIAWFAHRQAPFFFWWTGPSTRPLDLGARLVKRGLLDMAEQQQALATDIVQTEAGAPTMALELGQADVAWLERVPPDFTIEEVASESALADFKTVFVESYGIPEFAGQAWVDATRAIGIGRTPWRLFVGRLAGRAVATNMLFCGGGVASVYAVATLPEARGRGIGGAITLAPLLEARDSGYDYAALFSTEKGVPAYQRIGFRTVPGRINRYLWRAP